MGELILVKPSKDLEEKTLDYKKVFRLHRINLKVSGLF